MKNKWGESQRILHKIVLPYEGDDCLPWPTKQKGRYVYLWDAIEKKVNRVHRIICLIVHGDPPTDKHVAAHSCGNSWCVNKRHISWKTNSENQLDRVAHGTDMRGDKHPNAKLKWDQVRKIRSLQGQFTQKEIAEIIGVSAETVSYVLGRGWKE